VYPTMAAAKLMKVIRVGRQVVGGGDSRTKLEGDACEHDVGTLNLQNMSIFWWLRVHGGRTR
jgi:hypothetical protein